jgi:HK97 family phage major capsid protein
MRITTQIEEAQRLHSEAIERMDEQDTKIQALPDDIADDERKFHRGLFEKYEREAERAAETLERLVAIEAARANRPGPKETDTDNVRIEVGPEPSVYAKRAGAPSFFKDVIDSTISGDILARERLERHGRQMAAEQRDLTTVATAGGGFVPPVYLGDYYAEFARQGRPLANVIPSSPLQSTGMTLSIPRITTGTAVTHIVTENSTAPAETNIVETTLNVPVVTIAGMQDVSQALFDRSDPGIDQIVFNDLREAYDTYLDTQLISGSGANGQHMGLTSVASTNSVTYTTATPTAAGLHPKVYDAIQKVATVRFRQADTLVAHPRRTAWLASNLSSTFPLYQQGSLYQAAGQQDVGTLTSFAGLRVVHDANILTNYGASTNEDEIYVIRAADMHLWEGPQVVRVMPEVGSGTLTVRLILHAYSAFASGRFPGSISVITGTGLVTPTF